MTLRLEPTVEAARARLLDRLAGHAPFDDDEAEGLARLQAFVAGAAEPFARATTEGHVTGSTLVVRPDGATLLLHHAKLGLWVQPGGHCDAGEHAEDAAAREAREESGLPDLAFDLGPDGLPRVFDVDVHPIPANAKRNEPAHFHFDVCFVARTRRPEATTIDVTEAHAARWVDRTVLDEAASGRLSLDRATIRRLRKLFS